MLRDLNQFTWDEFAELDPAELTYVLPIGSLEQHGRHLALGADDFILRCVMDRLHALPDVPENMICLPTIHYGNSHEHISYRGVISLSCETLASMVRDILKCMKEHGIHRLAIINSHGGNTALLEAYAQQWEHEYGVKVYTISFWSPWFFRGAELGVETPLNLEIHAGEMETSILECAMPEAVRPEKATPELDNPVELLDYYCGWNTAEVAPGNGQMGMASRATPEKGERILSYMAEKIKGYLVDIDNKR